MFRKRRVEHWSDQCLAQAEADRLRTTLGDDLGPGEAAPGPEVPMSSGPGRPAPIAGVEFLDWLEPPR